MLFEMVLSFFLVSPDFNLILAKNMTNQGYYEESDKLLEDKRIRQNYEYHFCKMVNALKQNNRSTAEYHLKYLEDTFEPMPRRYKSLIYLVRNDMESWSADGLDDIARDMRNSGDRLGVAKSDKKTQEIQKEIVRKLEKKIKDLEDKAKGASGQGDGDAGEIKKVPLPSQGDPALESIIMGTSGKGQIDEKKLRGIAEGWGNLPPEKRAKVVEDITRDVPQKYKTAIEEYFKALNRIYK
jgi:hypothetical protein